MRSFKHPLFSALITAVSILLACNPNKTDGKDEKHKDEPVSYTPQPGTYTFVIPEFTITGEDGVSGIKTKWEAGDRILVHGNYFPTSVTVTLSQDNISADGHSATVEMTEVPTTGAVPDKLYAAYPADNISDEMLFCESRTRFIPKGSMLMTAFLGKDNIFEFKHITGAITFSVSEPCDSFVIVGNRSEPLAFDFLVTEVTSQSESYEVEVGEDHRFYREAVDNGSGTAHIAVQTEFGPKGFNVYLKKGNLYPKVYHYSSAATVSRGTVLNLGDISSKLEDYDGAEPVEPIMPVMGKYERVMVNVEELSGICLTAEKDALWAVGDQGQLAKVSFDGKVTNIHHFNNDLEAVTLHPETGDLYFAVEGSQRVYRCSAPYTSYQSVFRVDEASGYGNSGLEGIAYYKDNLLYVGSQFGINLWTYNLDGEMIDKVSLGTLTRNIREIGGLCYDSVNDWLWVTDSETHRLLVFSGDASTFLTSYQVTFCGNNESVCVDHERGMVYVGDDDDNNPSIYKIQFTGLKPEDR